MSYDFTSLCISSLLTEVVVVIAQFTISIFASVCKKNWYRLLVPFTYYIYYILLIFTSSVATTIKPVPSNNTITHKKFIFRFSLTKYGFLLLYLYLDFFIYYAFLR